MENPQAHPWHCNKWVMQTVRLRFYPKRRCTCGAAPDERIPRESCRQCGNPWCDEHNCCALACPTLHLDLFFPEDKKGRCAA